MNIDLNADVGEGYDDEPLFELVSSVNIACGAHAGDEETMDRAVRTAHRLGLSIGAHPGYPDRRFFGRSELDLDPNDLARLLTEQLEALDRIAARHGATLRHVKPHGALYNQASEDPGVAETIVEAVRSFRPELRLVGLAGSILTMVGRDAGLSVLEEGFADRRYRFSGLLAPRDEPDAVIEDPATAARQAIALARGHAIETVVKDAWAVLHRADTICVHGDTPGALAIARAVRAALDEDGIPVAHP